MMMPIETIPEQKTLSGPELEAAITDGIQRAIGRRVNNIRISFADGSVIETQHVRISVDVVGSLKGPKPGAKRKPRASKPTPAA